MKDTITEFTGRYAYLSNFAPSPVYVMVGLKWVKCPTVEHGFQASKTLIERERLRIIHAATPGDAKRLGRSVRYVSYWQDVKTIIMLELLRQKFSRAQFRRKLIMTGRAELIEGNHWHDNEWGSCHCITCGLIDGENKLGRLLMRVRHDVR